MAPRKDYEDYLKFISEANSAEFNTLMSDDAEEKVTARTPMAKGSKSIFTRDRKSLDASTTQYKGGFETAKQSRNMSTIRGSEKPSMGKTTGNFFHARNATMIANKLASPSLGLSDGFKKIFPGEKRDVKMTLPIAGYGGHRRGDRSQNFFGKPFRETSLQSKKLEREFRMPRNFISSH